MPPTISQQLTLLLEQQLDGTRREGKHIYSTLSSPQALALLQTLSDQYCGRGAQARDTGRNPQ